MSDRDPELTAAPASPPSPASASPPADASASASAGSSDPPAAPDSPPSTHSPDDRHTLRTIAIFAALVAVLGAVDLTLKWWAFDVFANASVKQILQDARARQQQYTGDDAAELPLAAFIRPPDDQLELIPHLLKIDLVLNTGAVFGMGQGRTWLFIGVTLVAIVVIGWTFISNPPRFRLLHLSLAMILAGALGNVYDRLVYGAVRDMLNLFPGVMLPFGWHWPGNASPSGRYLYPWIFNLADVFLVIGIALMLLRTFTLGRRPLGPT